MRILGIVAEYDPFHNGHADHLRRAREAVKPDAAYITLSPCFRQRGELALLSPSDRAACALDAGADAVFALPVLWALRDAEHYALGAVSMLAGLGATHLAFGAEDADLMSLQQIAELLEEPPLAFQATLREGLDSGTGYPAALAEAAQRTLPGAAALLRKPNNTLAICYLRAIRRLNLRLEPVAIPRTGDDHADRIDPASPSASALREALRRGDWGDALPALPAFCERRVRARFLEGRVPSTAIADALLLDRLRSLTPGEWRRLPDLSEGLEDRLKKAACQARTSQELLQMAATRRYPTARLRRICALALLGVTRDRLDALPLPDTTLLLALRKGLPSTAGWQGMPVRVYPSPGPWQSAADPEDLAAWRLWAQCCSLPPTLPFTERLYTL